MNATLDDLLRQARWLRFQDGATEQRYDEERFTSAMMRERVTLAACALASATLGLLEAYMDGPLYRYEGLMMLLHVIRFYGVIPLWVGLFLATFWKGFPRWAGAANAVVTVLSSWGHSLIVWSVVRVEPQRHLGGMLTGSTLLVVVVALLMLPMRFRNVVLVVVLALGGTLWFFNATLGRMTAHAANLAATNVDLPLVAGLILLVGWFREAADRRVFAQREHARRLADELAAANAELARLNAEKNEFMGIAAHDLRAPLATVRGFAELLRDGRLREEWRQALAFREIHTQATRMLGLVADYLGANAVAGAPLPVRRERIDLAAQARDACVRHEPAAKRKDQPLTAPDPCAPVWAHADPALLAQIADNLVSNALKFSPRGAPVRIEVNQRDGQARLAVVDQGPGIAADEQPRLFRRFGRTSVRPTDGESSHGLGLAVVKRLGEAMDGRVGCESKPGQGSTFWIELPTAN